MRKIPRFRPERPTQSPVCRPFRPLIIGSRFPVAHATGIGYVGPPGLKRATSKSTGGASGTLKLRHHCRPGVLHSMVLYQCIQLGDIALQRRHSGCRALGERLDQVPKVHVCCSFLLKAARSRKQAGKLTLRITLFRPLRPGQHTGRRAGVKRVDLHLPGKFAADSTNRDQALIAAPLTGDDQKPPRVG